VKRSVLLLSEVLQVLIGGAQDVQASENGSTTIEAHAGETHCVVPKCPVTTASNA
jgi:hypothetical protein